MSDRAVNLAQLRASLTVAQQNRKTARLVVMDLESQGAGANRFALEDAHKTLEARTREVEELERKIAAAGNPA